MKKRRYFADPSAIYKLMGRIQPFTASEQMQLNLPVRLAFDSLKNGVGSEGDFHTLASAVNIAMICAEKISVEVEDVCIAARDAMARMWLRYKRTERWGFDGPAIQEVADCIDVYEQLTGLLTGGQLKEAMQECVKRMQAGQVLE